MKRLVTLLAAGVLVMGVGPVSAAEYTPPVPEDFSSMGLTEAFDALVAKMSREYAFTQWKGLDWDALAKKYRPRVEAAGDPDAYYLALRAMLHETRDGHVSIRSEGNAEYLRVLQKQAGGGYGLIVSRLDDATVAATWVKKGGPAWTAGVRRGARITAWGGVGIERALRATSTVLAPAQPTRARKRYEQLRFLVRDPMGTSRSVTFVNPGAGKSRTVGMRAVDDNQQSLAKTDMTSVFGKGIPKDMVTFQMLPGRVGYVRVKAEIDLPLEYPGDHTPTLQQFRTAVASFIDRDVKGLVIDIRANGGGSDQMVADMMAPFYPRKSFYEYQNYINHTTGRFEIRKVDDQTGEYLARNRGIVIKPRTPRYTGPVVALVDFACISSCEGVAMGIKRLPNGHVVGFSGTNGSFGMVGDGVLMPGGLQIGWPYGQSLSRDKVVQIDSRRGKGGVLPDVVVEPTLSNVSQYLRGRDVVLQEGLRVVRE